MSESTVKIGFLVRPYDGLTIEADSDADAIEEAKTAAKTAIESGTSPEHIEIEERRGRRHRFHRLHHAGRPR